MYNTRHEVFVLFLFTQQLSSCWSGALSSFAQPGGLRAVAQEVLQCAGWERLFSQSPLKTSTLQSWKPKALQTQNGQKKKIGKKKICKKICFGRSHVLWPSSFSFGSPLLWFCKQNSLRLNFAELQLTRANRGPINRLFELENLGATHIRRKLGVGDT